MVTHNDTTNARDIKAFFGKEYFDMMDPENQIEMLYNYVRLLWDKVYGPETGDKE